MFAHLSVINPWTKDAPTNQPMSNIRIRTKLIYWKDFGSIWMSNIFQWSWGTLNLLKIISKNNFNWRIRKCLQNLYQYNFKANAFSLPLYLKSIWIVIYLKRDHLIDNNKKSQWEFKKQFNLCRNICNKKMINSRFKNNLLI